MRLGAVIQVSAFSQSGASRARAGILHRMVCQVASVSQAQAFLQSLLHNSPSHPPIFGISKIETCLRVSSLEGEGQSPGLAGCVNPSVSICIYINYNHFMFMRCICTRLLLAQRFCMHSNL